jgi:triacylglycerol lipase
MLPIVLQAGAGSGCQQGCAERPLGRIVTPAALPATTAGRRGVVRIQRRVLGVFTSVLLVALGSVGTASARGPDPILLVHGYRGNPSTWQDMIDAFAAEGRSAVAIDLPSEDNLVNARSIRDFITARGWQRVDIIGQSMGGLSARQFVRFLRSDTPARIDAYVSLATPHYGLQAACLLPPWYGGQMCPSSQFLRELNQGDDTPGRRIAWTTIYSTGDRLVPVASSRLDGGACHVQVSGVGHNDMDNDPGVFAHVLAAVDGRCTGERRP